MELISCASDFLLSSTNSGWPRAWLKPELLWDTEQQESLCVTGPIIHLSSRRVSAGCLNGVSRSSVRTVRHMLIGESLSRRKNLLWERRNRNLKRLSCVSLKLIADDSRSNVLFIYPRKGSDTLLLRLDWTVGGAKFPRMHRLLCACGNSCSRMLHSGLVCFLFVFS